MPEKISSESLFYWTIQIPALLFVFALATLSILVGYRLTLHPLARVPGPLLAAATGAYEAYFQLVKQGGGRYWVEVERLHKIYGQYTRHRLGLWMYQFTNT